MLVLSWVFTGVWVCTRQDYCWWTANKDTLFIPTRRPDMLHSFDKVFKVQIIFIHKPKCDHSTGEKPYIVATIAQHIGYVDFTTSCSDIRRPERMAVVVSPIIISGTDALPFCPSKCFPAFFPVQQLLSLEILF